LEWSKVLNRLISAALESEREFENLLCWPRKPCSDWPKEV
jgi:hypothetical protein